MNLLKRAARIGLASLIDLSRALTFTWQIAWLGIAVLVAVVYRVCVVIANSPRRGVRWLARRCGFELPRAAESDIEDRRARGVLCGRAEQALLYADN